MVELVGRDLGDERRSPAGSDEIAAHERHVVADRREVGRVGARVAHHAHDLAAGRDQQLGEVGAVLPADARDERAARQARARAGTPATFPPSGTSRVTTAPGRHDGVRADPARPEDEGTRADPGARSRSRRPCPSDGTARWRASRVSEASCVPVSTATPWPKNACSPTVIAARLGVEERVVDVRGRCRWSTDGRAAPRRGARATSAPPPGRPSPRAGRAAARPARAAPPLDDRRQPRRDDPVDDAVHAPSHRVTDRREPVGERHARQSTKGVEWDLLDSNPAHRPPATRAGVVLHDNPRINPRDFDGVPPLAPCDDHPHRHHVARLRGAQRALPARTGPAAGVDVLGVPLALTDYDAHDGLDGRDDRRRAAAATSASPRSTP